ncbi:MAG: hypothetical protein QM500_21285 [Methylococcales bacterium]
MTTNTHFSTIHPNAVPIPLEALARVMDTLKPDTVKEFGPHLQNWQSIHNGKVDAYILPPNTPPNTSATATTSAIKYSDDDASILHISNEIPVNIINNLLDHYQPGTSELPTHPLDFSVFPQNTFETSDGMMLYRNRENEWINNQIRFESDYQGNPIDVAGQLIPGEFADDNIVDRLINKIDKLNAEHPEAYIALGYKGELNAQSDDRVWQIHTQVQSPFTSESNQKLMFGATQSKNLDQLENHLINHFSQWSKEVMEPAMRYNALQPTQDDMINFAKVAAVSGNTDLAANFLNAVNDASVLTRAIVEINKEAPGFEQTMEDKGIYDNISRTEIETVRL